MTIYIDPDFFVKVLKFELSQLFSSYNKTFGLATSANQPVILDPGCEKISFSLYLLLQVIRIAVTHIICVIICIEQ